MKYKIVISTYLYFNIINPTCIYHMFLITSVSGIVMKQDYYQYMF